MPLRINGATSGYVQLAAPNAAGSTALVLPTDSVQPGMVLITSSSFTTASAVNVDNCFTATYDNYVVLLRCLTTTSQAVYMRLRLSGTDATTGYVMRMVQNDGTLGVGTTGTTYLVSPTMSTGSGGGFIYLTGPALAAATHASVGYVASNGAGAAWSTGGGGVHDTATAYDGFSLIPGSSTITGSLKVYGYRNSITT